ncbi:MAG: S41 family peptidase [Bacillota bacterium]|nr:S41 family peptidase [Bacillota bacterium]
METDRKRAVFIWVAVILILLVGTNLWTYFATGKSADSGDEDPTRVIKFEPAQSNYDEDTEILFEAMDAITNNYYTPVDEDILIEGAVQGMIESLGDPQVQYYDADALDAFLLNTQGSYGGIGVRIIEVEDDVVVFETFASTPAEREGLTPGDRIIEADGHDLSGKGIDYVVELLRGPANTFVDIVIKRPGADEPIVLKVEREEIRVASVFSEMLEDGLGYIKISSFDSHTAEEFTSQFKTIEQSGLSKGLILDMRDNPGGLVDQAVAIAKLLVPEGEIVRLVGRNDDVKTIYYSSAVKKPYPIVVLINEESASSAELLAGALQDRGAALLVGKTTFGKASVQQLVYLSDDQAILLTMARYFTPSGRDIHQHGIEPDFEVDMPEILRYYRYFLPGRLERGDYGPHVEMLQMMLEQIGYTIDVIGYFDEQTTRALTDFQTAAGIKRSGVFDDQTWIQLREALDIAAREQDEQLNFALDLIHKPGLWNITEGND